MSEKWMPQVERSTTATDEGLRVSAPSLRPADGATLVAEVEEWLRTEVRPSAPVLWCPRGTAETAVRGADAMAAKVATLASEGEWAVARRTHGRTWAQCMRVDKGWIVEVNGIPGPDCCARRVRATGWRGRMLRGPRRVRDRGRVMALYGRADVIGSAEVAGAIMWAWLRGTLPAGYGLRGIRVGCRTPPAF